MKMIQTTFLIYSKSYKYNYTSPWKGKHGDLETGQGSAFAVELAGQKVEKFIITNAHVVSREDAFLQVVKWDSATRYTAELVNFAPEVDLALLKITDKADEFWQNVPILPFASTTKGEKVQVVGFPYGGYNASITRGIVSRLAPIKYFKSIDNMSIQIDAAINSGNSGGPVFDKTGANIVGMAFMHTAPAQNMCNIIPEFIIKHYLEEMANGGFNGVCDLEIDTMPVLNKTQQSYYMPANGSGVIITNVSAAGCAGLILEKNDILHAIDSIVINNDGTVCLNNEKVPYWHIIRMKHPGDEVVLTIYRKKKAKSLKCRVEVGPMRLVPILDKHINFDYININGLIFQSLNWWHIFSSNNKRNKECLDWCKYYKLLPYALDYYREYDNHEIVILSAVEPNEQTDGYSNLAGMRLVSINGKEINNLAHARKMCENARDPVVFELDSGVSIAISKLKKSMKR